MSGHRHAALMAEYARIAQQYEEPWEFFEWLPEDGKWNGLRGHPSWDIYTEYRLKPRTIRIGVIDVPMPEKTEPEHGVTYFYPAIKGEKSICIEDKWEGREDQKTTLRRGLLHMSVEAAYIHAKALILVSGGKV